MPEATTPLRSDAALLTACAAAILFGLHFFCGNSYGFHRDELQFLDDARHLQWGFVAYPPLTSFAARLAISLFGISPQVVRLPATAINVVSLVIAGLIARELGGRRAAQLLTLAACLPLAAAFASVLQYNTTDLLAWSAAVFFTARLLRSEDERNWIGVGAGIGLGVLSKYSIAFLVFGLLIGLAVLPSQRRHLRERWFWFGALTALVIAAPNLVWLASHHFVTLRMESFIHARDVRNGRAEGYFSDQVKYTLLALPLGVTGLISLLRSPRFRLLSTVYLGPFLLFALAKGRSYYLLPAYAVLYAAGAVALERSLSRARQTIRATVYTLAFAGMFADLALIGLAFLPVFRPGTPAFQRQLANSSDLSDEVGWPDFVEDVARVRDGLPPADRARLAVLANNYGEAGALALYGPRYGLPVPIASVNSFFYRSFGPYPPETVIVTGSNLAEQLRNFGVCNVAGQVHIPYGVRNEESKYHTDILVCRRPRLPWPEAWVRSQAFG